MAVVVAVRSSYRESVIRFVIPRVYNFVNLTLRLLFVEVMYFSLTRAGICKASFPIHVAPPTSCHLFILSEMCVLQSDTLSPKRSLKLYNLSYAVSNKGVHLCYFVV